MKRERLTKEAVLKAIDECEEVGPEAFRKKYGFRRARDYFLVVDGVKYDSKAIVAVAYKNLPGGHALKPTDLYGGKFDTAEKLDALGFEVSKLEKDADWIWDEHVLALDLYMKNREKLPTKGSAPVRSLSGLLRKLGNKTGAAKTAKYRNANGVAMKLMNFRRLDQESRSPGLPHGAKGEEKVWKAYANDKEKLARDAAAIRAAIEDESVDLRPLDDEYEAEEGAVILRLHRSKERDSRLSRKKKRETLSRTGRLSCEVCGFDFFDRYGEYGEGYIEAHHRRPISSLSKPEKTKLSDLALVCANCHRMLHKKIGLLDLQDLKKMLRK